MERFRGKLARTCALLLACAGASALLVWLLGAVLPTPPGPLLAAVLASLLSGAIVLLASSGGGDAGVGRFFATVGQAIDDIMIGAAETSYFVDSVKKKIESDVRIADEIVERSQHNADTTEQIAVNAERAAQVAAAVRKDSMAGRADIDQGLQRISSARGDARLAADTLVRLQDKSRRIKSFTEVITEISARTNLLALNAAIEAARAGEHGRGFAVVAAEVRQLAQRTKEAADEIGQMVRSINDEAEQAGGGMASLVVAVNEAAANVEKVHASLTGIEQSSAASEQEIGQIAGAAREQVDTAQRIAHSLAGIRDSMLHTEQALPRAADSAMALAERAEAIAGALGESALETPHDAIRVAAQRAAAEVGQLFSAAIKHGQISREALFDRHYKPIPNTNPQKHSSRFDAFTDRVLPPLQEGLLAAMPQLAYAGAVDDHGYFPTHNKKFSQPLTGNYEVDFVNNRTKRIFNDRTGARCGSHTKPFLLQTYKRDTGEVMHDLSVPIYVDGQHWGGFRVGYRSSGA